MILVGAACLGVSATYGLHPDGIALVWHLLLSCRELCYGLLLLTQVGVVAGSLWFLGQELAAYGRWKVGCARPQDARREASWAVALNRFGTPARLGAALVEAAREAWHERRRTSARARRRWPRKKRELIGWLAQDWSARIWVGVALVVGGEALMGYLSYWIPGYTLTPLLSLGAALVGLAVGNALVLLGWIAGDDDEGGHRSSPPAPRAPQGYKHPKRVRRTLSLRVQRTAKQWVKAGG